MRFLITGSIAICFVYVSVYIQYIPVRTFTDGRHGLEDKEDPFIMLIKAVARAA